MKSLPLSIVQTIRDWVKAYITAHTIETITLTVNFQTGNLEYTTNKDT